MNEEYKYCSGKHKCRICGNIYDCHGVEYGHTGSKGYRCHGKYVQFCNNHTLEEERLDHVKHGELDP